MLRKIIGYGTVAGLIVGIASSTITATLQHHMPEPYGLVTGYLIMLVAVSLVFVAAKHQRDVAQRGVIGLLPALGLGLGISFVASLFYVAAWELTQAITHMDFAGSYARSVIDAQEAKGVNGAALAQVTADMAAFRVNYADPLYRLPMTFAEIFPVGVLISLVSAALLSNSRFLPARRSA